MTLDKGYKNLLLAYLSLNKIDQKQIILNFGGGFRSIKEEKLFMKEIKDHKNIFYHGIVEGRTKKNLFHNAHLFVLPTKLLEGQPLSILEAYASGCCVLTTQKPGIMDIFQNFKNGFLL